MIRIIDEARELLSTRILTRPTLNDMALIDTGLAAGQVAAKELAAARLHVDALQAQVSAVKVAYSRLMNYRHNNTLNFQLEKLDDYLRELNDALEGGE